MNLVVKKKMSNMHVTINPSTHLSTMFDTSTWMQCYVINIAKILLMYVLRTYSIYGIYAFMGLCFV